ncbi:MAG: hypothetical protein KA902_06940, partial [Arenimonas sp.]|nr:hypothetical protein [Arenimonas sp.]
MLSIAISLVLSTAVFASSPETPGTIDKVEVRGFPFRYQSDAPTSVMKTETELKDIPQSVSIVTEQQ